MKNEQVNHHTSEALEEMSSSCITPGKRPAKTSESVTPMHAARKVMPM